MQDSAKARFLALRKSQATNRNGSSPHDNVHPYLPSISFIVQNGQGSLQLRLSSCYHGGDVTHVTKGDGGDVTYVTEGNGRDVTHVTEGGRRGREACD